ncbi:MAG TPA: DUF3570 domain-containing protein, partial [Candidatus Saccharimonadales bacterium]|nr:DUF3570 domain-containing protein [Candidatus Saccharimonadales bacterium]
MNPGKDPSRSAAPTGRQKKIATALAVATCSLLGMHHGPSAADAEPGDTLVDAGVLFFNEQGRVQDLSGTALIRHFLEGDRSVTLRVVYDALTGASANGAVPANRPQTFTSASGSKGYTTPSGETPLDTTFHDQRLAVDGTWNQPLGLTSHGSFGATFSTETDYLSTGVNARLSRD